MKRLFWLGLGAAVGVIVVRAVTKRAQAYTPRGIASSMRRSTGGLVGSVRSFMDDVRVGMAEREQRIHEAFAEGVALDEDDLDDLYPERGTVSDGGRFSRKGTEGTR
ncbi:MAG TPA: hypothetical protein VGJ53_02150 [Micromonosporaceae bacterium]|jgi:hypothetical protein